MDWQRLEDDVRAAAAAKWKLPCKAETIHGVRCDAVVRLRSDYLVLIEITKSDTLGKLREDLTKHGAMRLALMAEQKYAECYFVTSGDESSLVATGRGLNVEVLNVESFAAKFVGSSQYLAARRTKPFGSAVDPDSGKQDSVPYIPIRYVSRDGINYTPQEIVSELTSGRHIILQGEFGTGKSRCLWQVFEHLTSMSGMFAPVAINLRDNWGYSRFHHIIQNHLDSLGLGDFCSSMVTSLTQGRQPILLDGFDEIGSQSWAGDPGRLAEVRMQSHRGVRDLISECRTCGILVTGREHYFNSEAELIECLGISGDYLSLRCPDEFTDDEIRAYLSAAVGIDVAPEWMPKKPLICRLLARLDKAEIERIQSTSSGEVEFFENVFDAVCEREKLINTSTTAEAIKAIILSIAQISRKHTEADERITLPEINQAFLDATGVPPIDESAILLQRLPYIGRFSGDSPDRKFVDTYAKDGLRGLAAAKAVAMSDTSIGHMKWRQPLGFFGVDVFSNKLQRGQGSLKFIRNAINKGNDQIGCDYVAAQNIASYGDIDYGNLTITSGSISVLSFIDSDSKNLVLNDVYIGKISLDNAKFTNISFTKCLIDLIEGVGSKAALPHAFDESCHIEKFEPALTVARISEMQLSNAHKTLLALIKKLFFQPGAGRQEDALLRGAEAYWDSNAADDVLRFMISNKLVTKEKGSHGVLYVPQRRYTRRMGRIMDARAASQDELWKMCEKA